MKKKEVNVIITDQQFFNLINTAFAHARYDSDYRIVFNGEILGIDYGSKDPQDNNYFIVGCVFKHQYFSKLKMPEGSKPSKSDPEMTEFSYWLAKRIHHYGNKTAERFFYKGVHLCPDTESEHYVEGLETLIHDLQLPQPFENMKK